MMTGIEYVLAWLATPISGASVHVISTEAAWHGRLMVLIWGGLVPAGVLIARYFKVTPHQNWPHVVGNSFWFVWHRVLGYAALAGTLAAVGAIAFSYGFINPFNSFHSFTGWISTALVIVLVAATLLRGTHGGPVNPFTKEPLPPDQWFGDHYNMTPRRIFFEYTHKYGGWALLVISVGAICSGLWRADAPRWMWLALAAWWGIMIAWGVFLQIRGKCLDTYQAIWGPAPDLPGGRRRPIGWGIRRIQS